MSGERRGLGSGTKIIIGIIVVVLLFVIFLSGKYNRMVKAEERVKTEFSNISVQLQRRNDLIPNLVNTVKGYATHEKETFKAVTDARERMMGANTVNETVEADGELTQALGRLIAVAEAYPELKANENFLSLQDQLEGTENRIAVARKDYNQTVNDYNIVIRSFPTNIIAGMFGFEKYELYQGTEQSEQVPVIDFE